MANADEKQKIRQRYKGIALDEIEKIPAIEEKDIFDDDSYKRVGVYARVSTDDPRQTSSFELQRNHYTDLIDRRPGWNLYRIYADEGISGTSLKHRDAFLEMIEDCKSHKIDLIVTKSVSRFARNMQAYSTYPSILVKAMTLMMLLLAAAAVLVWLCGKKTGLGEKILGMVLILLLPLGMNLIYVLVIGASHDLMVFALWLFYLLLLLLTEWLVQQWQGMGKKEQLAQCIRVLSLLLVLVTVYGSVQFANGLYMKKELEYDGYFSLMTRIVDRMEDEEGYIPGQTPVVFVGMPSNKNGMIPGFLEYWNVIGAMSTDVIYMPEKTRYQAYFDYVLNTPMLLAEDDPWMTLRDSQLAKEMSPYPAANCIAWQDGTMIVKLG